ncbi:MAG: hypothetical protein KDA68_04520 [Planctomycetaceae bacterium]|nr:hypothetical protein [Planctomycetaceae bacterium]
MNRENTIFDEKPECVELYERIMEGCLLGASFSAPHDFPVATHLVTSLSDLLPFQESDEPDSRIIGRDWCNVTGSSSLPVDYFRTLRSMEGVSSMMTRGFDYLYNSMKPKIEQAESRYSIRPGRIKPFLDCGMKGRYVLGRNNEHLYEIYNQVILHGGLPCGWIASFPDDMKCGEYPSDGILVVFSP